MRQLSEIANEREAMTTILELTSVFEGIASMHIAQVKDQVQSSTRFFGELWRIYSQIRVDERFHFGRGQRAAEINPKELLIVVTSEGSFSGDIDQRLIAKALKYYRSEHNDILAIGQHGAIQLAQSGITPTKVFKLPEKDRNINVTAIIGEVQKYATTMVYYQTYVSLMTQDVNSIQLSTAVAERGKSVDIGDETISEQNYLFEPSAYEVVDHLERSMMQIALSEVILESKLAQYASRFKAMSASRDKADESLSELNMLFHRSQRRVKDERLKEIVNGLRKARI